jgi:membrane-associated protein
VHDMVDVIDGLVDVLAGVPFWGLAAAVAIAMALEASLLTGVFVPGDLIVLAAGSTVRTPSQFSVLITAVTIGSVVGEVVGYSIGHRLGYRLQRSRVGRLIGPQRWSRAGNYLERRGVHAVFAGRFLAALHAILPIVAGSVRMNFRRFLTACLAGAASWSALYVTIGALAGASYRAVAEQMNVASGVVVGGLIGAALFSGIAVIRRGVVGASRNVIDVGVALATAAVVSFGITIAHESGARSPDAVAFALGIASAGTLLGHRRRPTLVLGETLVASFAYLVIGYPAGPMDVPVWIALFSTAANGRANLALVTGGALSGIGVAYRILVENDPVGMETFSTAALLLTLALLGDSVHRRRLTEEEPSVAIRNDRR